VLRWVQDGRGHAAPATVPLAHWFDHCREAVRQGRLRPGATQLAARLLQATDAGPVLQALCGSCPVDVPQFARQPLWQQLGSMDWRAYWTQHGGRVF
jgi:hypothetical protein